MPLICVCAALIFLFFVVKIEFMTSLVMWSSYGRQRDLAQLQYLCPPARIPRHPMIIIAQPLLSMDVQRHRILQLSIFLQLSMVRYSSPILRHGNLLPRISESK